MKFLGTPNMLIKERKRKHMSQDMVMKPVLRFDENGEYSTDDVVLIEKLKRKFKHIPGLRCNKCSFETENKGDLLAHYRKQHPKEG